MLIFRYLVLVNYPFERAAVAQAIFKGFGRDARKRERRIHLERAAVLGQAHLVFYAVGKRQVAVLLELERVGFELFVFGVQARQFLSGLGEGPEFVGKRDARQLALQVLGIPRAVLGMMQDAVNIIEDVPPGDFLSA